MIPSLISSVLISMYAIIDGIFVGQKIGDLGLSAINIIWPVTALLQGLGTAIGLSGGILISTLIGKNEIEKSNKIKSTILIIITILGIFLGLLFYIIKEPLINILGASKDSYPFALEYLRIILAGSVFQMLGVGMLPLLKNSGKVKSAMLASLASIGVNLILDYVFLFPLDMNLDGAALASVIAQFVSFLICFITYFKELVKPLINLDIIKRIFKGCIAPFILNYSYSIIIIITNIVAMKYGGDPAVAAYTLLSYILYIINACGCAVGDSIQPLFSYHEARKERNINHKMLKKCVLISLITCTVLTILIFIFRKNLGILYNLSEKAYIEYSYGLIYYSIGFLLVSFIKVISSYLYAVNDIKLANLLIVIEPFLLTPIILISLSSLIGIKGVWSSYLIVQVLLFIFTILIMSYRLKKENSKAN